VAHLKAPAVFWWGTHGYAQATGFLVSPLFAWLANHLTPRPELTHLWAEARAGESGVQKQFPKPSGGI